MKLDKKKYSILALIVAVASILLFINFNKNGGEKIESEERVKIVSTIIVGEDLGDERKIETVGLVKAATEVPIIAMQTGNASNIYFKVGDVISAGQTLARLKNSALSTNLVNAQTDFSNRSHNMEVVKISAEQDIKSTEIALQNAQNNLDLAKIQLESAQNTFENGLTQIEKNKDDLKENSLVNYQNNIASIYDSLDKINYIIKAEGQSQISGIENIIAAKNKQTLSTSKISYFEAKACHKAMLAEDIDLQKAEYLTEASINCLGKTKKAIDDVIVVLENTISSSDFSESILKGEISKFNQLRISILASESTTRSLNQSLKNINVNEKSETDKLKSNLEVAKNQVNLTLIAYENAQLIVDKAKSSKEQQVISSQIAKDNSRGQLALARDSASDLIIKSPIDGVVTSRSIELGEEVSPSKTIAEISKLDLVKITASLSSTDAYQIKVGDKVIIEDKFEGFVSQISPSADDQSKKVEINIAYDNGKQDLIVETFVNIKIPIEKEVLSESGYFLVPLKALSLSQSESFVFIVENGRAKRVDVKIGDITSNMVEIVEGLSRGDQLITEGNKTLSNDAKIEIN